jgi:hypothetical protein
MGKSRRRKQTHKNTTAFYLLAAVKCDYGSLRSLLQALHKFAFLKKQQGDQAAYYKKPKSYSKVNEMMEESDGEGLIMHRCVYPKSWGLLVCPKLSKKIMFSALPSRHGSVNLFR